MALFSYVVARDYGFAPNPFGGFITLATCKPNVRGAAKIGDWIVGTGSAEKKRRGRIVYAMRVSETMPFDQYWADPRFRIKRPNLQSSRKHAFGDNIYHRLDGNWTQENSHHSFADGTPNQRNIDNDTQADRVLIGERFAYWGGDGPAVPDSLRKFQGHDLCIGRGHKVHFPEGMEAAFAAWFESLAAQGVLGRPLEWGKQ